MNAFGLISTSQQSRTDCTSFYFTLSNQSLPTPFVKISVQKSSFANVLWLLHLYQKFDLREKGIKDEVILIKNAAHFTVDSGKGCSLSASDFKSIDSFIRLLQ